MALKGTYNHVHNILRLFDGLANFPFTTSGHQTRIIKVQLLVINWYIRAASGVAKLLKGYNLRKLGNIRKTLKLHRIIV